MTLKFRPVPTPGDYVKWMRDKGATAIQRFLAECPRQPGAGRPGFVRALMFLRPAGRRKVWELSISHSLHMGHAECDRVPTEEEVQAALAIQPGRRWIEIEPQGKMRIFISR